jgi:SAM-dependent methyltransferase
VTQTLEESYDDVPYEGQGFHQSHPDRMATLARLHGVDAPPVAIARVLEVGCGPGGNLAPMAASLPDARFVGVDLSKNHVELGVARLAAAGIANVELHHANLTSLGETLGAFDYVIAHGLYSWVPPPVAEELLALCARSLAPNGIAYVSFNTLPGWYGRSVIRDLMRFHAEREKAAPARVKLGREMLAWLKETLPDGGRYAQPLAQDVTSLTKETDHYLAHELLCEDNHPIYFADLVARAARHGLRYVDDASPEITAQHGTTALAATARDKGAGDAVRTEQYFDFLHGRTFRRALLCRAAVDVNPGVRTDAVDGLRVASRVRPTGATAPDPKARGPAVFAGQRGELTSDHLLTKAALLHLADLAPLSLPFPALVDAARARLDAAEASHRDVGILRRFLVRSFLSTGGEGIELRTVQPEAVARAGERPAVTAWAREEAKRHARVTSTRHEGVPLDDTLRLLVPLLDGTRTEAELLAEWTRVKGRAFTPAAMKAALAMLAQQALLVR